MRRTSARFVVVSQALREAIDSQLHDLGLGVTSPEIDASTNTVRKVLDPGEPASVNLGTLARLCLSVELTPADAEELGEKALAREMRRLAPDPFISAVQDTLRRKD